MDEQFYDSNNSYENPSQEIPVYTPPTPKKREKKNRLGFRVCALALVFGNTSLDLDTCTLVCGGKSVRLSAREFDVMRFLLQAQDRILSKGMILARVWGYDSNAVENHVEVYVGFLRKKLSAINSNVRIEAVRRLGYRLEVAEG